MKISINQITPRREGDEISSVLVHFTAQTADGNINISGNTLVSNFSDLINFEGIENEVKQEVINKIMNGDSTSK